jgi:putative ABC transport system permease protein
MALGADAQRVVAAVLTHAMWPVVIGVAFGLGAALLLGRYLTSLLFAISPADPTTLVWVSGVMLAAALLAAWLPARRAARTSPVEALRHS